MPVTTRKYMSDGEPGVARATYLVTLKAQVWIAAGITAVALILVLALSDLSSTRDGNRAVLGLKPFLRLAVRGERNPRFMSIP